MTHYLKPIVCLAAVFCTPVAFAQVASAQTDDVVQAPAGSPVAFVYVSSIPSASKHEIHAFAAASNGQLTPVPGSPFSADVQSMAVNGQYLFGANGIDIYSFSIASDGALRKVASINAQQFNGGPCGGPYNLFLDHTGATLYDNDYDGNSCANNTFQSFGVEGSTGELNYLGMTTAASPSFYQGMNFTGSNVYAYGSSCYHFNPAIYGFMRNADGTLTYLNINPPLPVAQKGDFYCPYLGAAADPTNHVAIPVQELTGNWGAVGPPQLATYTVDGSGNLATQSTYANMPKTAVRAVTAISMSPSGKLLAVGGTAGLQVFHFNGSNPISRYTGLLTTDQVDQMFWDNDNHLYGISQSANKLFVFTITPTSVSQAHGSPHAVTNPQNIIVLPKT